MYLDLQIPCQQQQHFRNFCHTLTHILSIILGLSRFIVHYNTYGHTVTAQKCFKSVLDRKNVQQSATTITVLDHNYVCVQQSFLGLTTPFVHCAMRCWRPPCWPWRPEGGFGRKMTPVSHLRPFLYYSDSTAETIFASISHALLMFQHPLYEIAFQKIPTTPLSMTAT